MCIFKVCYLENTFSLKSLSRGLNSVYGSIPCHWHCWVFIHMCVFKPCLFENASSQKFSRLQPACGSIPSHQNCLYTFENTPQQSLRGYIQNVVPSPLIRRPQSHPGSTCFDCQTFKYQFSQEIINWKTFDPIKSYDNPYIWWWWDRTKSQMAFSWIYWRLFLCPPHWPTEDAAQPMRWIHWPFCDPPTPHEDPPCLALWPNQDNAWMKKRPWSWKGPLWSADDAARVAKTTITK